MGGVETPEETRATGSNRCPLLGLLEGTSKSVLSVSYTPGSSSQQLSPSIATQLQKQTSNSLSKTFYSNSYTNSRCSTVVRLVAVRMSYPTPRYQHVYSTPTKMGLPHRTNSMPVDNTSRTTKMVANTQSHSKTCKDDMDMTDVGSYSSEQEDCGTQDRHPAMGKENTVRQLPIYQSLS
jgi:hypothetical protein